MFIYLQFSSKFELIRHLLKLQRIFLAHNASSRKKLKEHTSSKTVHPKWAIPQSQVHFKINNTKKIKIFYIRLYISKDYVSRTTGHEGV